MFSYHSYSSWGQLGEMGRKILEYKVKARLVTSHMFVWVSCHPFKCCVDCQNKCWRSFPVPWVVFYYLGVSGEQFIAILFLLVVVLSSKNSPFPFMSMTFTPVRTFRLKSRCILNDNMDVKTRYPFNPD